MSLDRVSSHSDDYGGRGGGAYIYMGTTVGHPPQSVIIQIMLAICH